MHSLITVFASCLVAAGTMYPWSAASADDRPADYAGEPWWSNPPTATSLAANPPIRDGKPSVAAASESKATEIAAPGRARQATEFAPDPPGLRRPDTLPAVCEQDSPPAETSAAGTSAEKVKALGLSGGALDQPSPRQPAATAPAASPLPSPATRSTGYPGAPPATVSSPPATQGESAAHLGLGSHNDRNAADKRSPLSVIITVGGSLAIVLGLFIVVAWALRKTAPHGSLLLPKEVFEILGRAPLGARQQVQLLRCGNKLLLVSITPNGTETLTEVTDPLEVDRLAGICQQAHPKSATTAFRQVFQQLAPGAPGTPGRGEPSELDNLEPAGKRRKRYRWEEKHA